MDLYPGHLVPDRFALSFYVCFEIKTPVIVVQTDMKRNRRQAVQWTANSIRCTAHKEQVKIMYAMQIK